MDTKETSDTPSDSYHLSLPELLEEKLRIIEEQVALIGSAAVGYWATHKHSEETEETEERRHQRIQAQLARIAELSMSFIPQLASYESQAVTKPDVSLSSDSPKSIIDPTPATDSQEHNIPSSLQSLSKADPSTSFADESEAAQPLETLSPSKTLETTPLAEEANAELSSEPATAISSVEARDKQEMPDLYARIVSPDYIPAVSPPEDVDPITLTIESDSTIAIGDHRTILSGDELFIFNTLLCHRDKVMRSHNIREYGFQPHARSENTRRTTFSRSARVLLSQLAWLTDESTPVVQALGQRRGRTYQLNPAVVVVDTRPDTDHDIRPSRPNAPSPHEPLTHAPHSSDTHQPNNLDTKHSATTLADRSQISTVYEHTTTPDTTAIADMVYQLITEIDPAQHPTKRRVISVLYHEFGIDMPSHAQDELFACLAKRDLVLMDYTPDFQNQPTTQEQAPPPKKHHTKHTVRSAATKHRSHITKQSDEAAHTSLTSRDISSIMREINRSDAVGQARSARDNPEKRHHGKNFRRRSGKRLGGRGQGKKKTFEQLYAETIAAAQ
ncbi:MAG: hypothetical protein Q4B27_03725 [Candidatus Saccharibacteria bacterium]|nr:hypothetical protein [Candidatus Saccharibacteria bacterium]